MTTWRNPLDGTPGTIVTKSNGGGDPWSTVVGGEMVYVSTPVWSGSAAAVGTSDTTAYLLRQTQQTGRVKGVGYVRIPAPINQTLDVSLIRIYSVTNVGGSVQLTGAHGTTPRLTLQTRGSGPYTDRWTSAPLPWDTWFRVEVDLDPGTSPTTGAARLRWYLGDSTTPQGDSGWITGINTAGVDGGYGDVRHGTVAGVIIDHVGVRDAADALDDAPWTAFELGVTEPTRSNCGAGTDDVMPTTVIDGDVTVSAGQVLRDRIVRGYVRLHVGGSLVNCVVTGPAVAQKEIPLVYIVTPNGWNGTDVGVIDHCTLQPQAPYRSQGFSSAVGIRGYRITRSLILDLLDGFTVSGGLSTDVSTPPNVYIGGCYMSDLVALSPDPWIASFAGTHNDLIQHHGARVDYDASSVTVVGNSLDARPSASSNVTRAQILDGSKGIGLVGVMYSKGTGPYSAMRLDRNWMRGGIQTLQSVDAAIVGTLVATGNRWERGSADGGVPADGFPTVACYLSRAAMQGRTSMNDVWLTGGAASPIWRNP